MTEELAWRVAAARVLLGRLANAIKKVKPFTAGLSIMNVGRERILCKFGLTQRMQDNSDGTFSLMYEDCK